MAGVAVNVTGSPAQAGFEEAVTATLTGKIGFIAIVTAFDVAGFPEMQAALEVSEQVTISRFTGT